MNDGYHDMPPLVDSQRFDGSAPMMINNPNPWPSNDSFPGHLPIAAQPHSWSPGPPSFNPSQWPGWEAQAGATPLSWGSSMASTPPMMTGAPMAVMPVNLGIHSDGWPRPLAGREPKQENGLPWKNYDDDFDQSPPAHSRTSLSRSVSLSSSPSTASLHRAGSLSHKASIGLRGHAAEALKRPPREWRVDFTLVGNGLLSGFLGTRSRSKSLSRGANEPKVTLHPYIRYTTYYKAPMALDLRESPNALKFRALKERPLTSWDLMRFVCEPPLPFMRLYHAQLPWYIEVETQNPSGVTLYDMFCAINQCMMTQIQNADYYNVEMSSETRAQVADAWAARCRNEEERQQGIRRVDYLMGRVIMEGIQKGKDGLWEIKTRKPGPP
ncbi:hypothetical protein V8D89_002784 [Ganoderma adspersum]